MGARVIWESSILQQPHHKSQPSPSPSHRIATNSAQSTVPCSIHSLIQAIRFDFEPRIPIKVTALAHVRDLDIGDPPQLHFLSRTDRTGQDDIESSPPLHTTIHILPPLNIVVGRNQ